MPQVLKCYKCSFFQVHQTNKSNKWKCKLCGEKQSFKRYYGLGTAKECRIHVQKLNGMRGEHDVMKNNMSDDSDSSNSEDFITEPVKDDYKPVKCSKWSKYLDETETVEENTNENMTLGGAEVVLEIPKKRRKQNTNNFNDILTVKHGKIHKNDIPAPVIAQNPKSQNFPFDSQTSFHREYLIPEYPMNISSKWGDFMIQEHSEPVYTDILVSSGDTDS